jgi:leishmanolysin-like peptidase
MASICLVVLSALILVPTVAHNCIHDKLVAADSFHIITGEQSYEHGGRRLISSNFAPMRISPIFVNLAQDPLMLAPLIAFVQNKLLPAAIARWQSALAVQPVVGPLFAHRECVSAWTGFTPNLCSAFSAQTQCGDVGDNITINFDASLLGTDNVYASNGAATPLAAGAGLADADYGVFVTARATSACSGGTLAYAVTCQRDSFDRPTWGRINFCPGSLSTEDSDWDIQLYTAIHEVRDFVCPK